VGRVRAAAGLLIVPAFFLPIQALVFSNRAVVGQVSVDDRLKAAFWRDSGIGRFHDIVLYGRLGLLALFGVSIILGLAGWRPMRFLLAFEALVLIAFQTATVIWPPGVRDRPPRWVIEWMPWHFYPDRFGAGLMIAFCVAAFGFAVLDKAPPKPAPATPAGAPYSRGAGVGPQATFRGAGWGPTAAPGATPAPGRAPVPVAGAVTASSLADPSRTGQLAAVAAAGSPPGAPSGSASPFPAPFPTAPGYPTPPSSDAAIDADTTVWREATPRVWRDDDVTVLGEGDQLVWRDNDPTRVQSDPARSDP
jgi:hypothetical protein